MKLKYYLRGLGIGIIVTALVMRFLAGGADEITDEEVRIRAAQLGMVEESTTLADGLEKREQLAKSKKLSNSENAVSQNAVSENKISENKVSENVVTENTASQNAASQNVVSENAVSENMLSRERDEEAETKTKDVSGKEEKEVPAEQVESGNQTAEFVTVTVGSGQGSLQVAAACQRAGLVEDAAEFDLFLCSGGYDRRLVTGEHQIARGALPEEIAKALTTRN